MDNAEEDDIERMKRKVVDENRKAAKRPIAIHEAGHAVVAVRLGLPLESVTIEEDEKNGPRFGHVRLRQVFSEEEFQERSPAVLEYLRKRIIMWWAGEAATRIILGLPDDKFAGSDRSEIRHILNHYPEP